jgi:adrenodoxin-NADP+ reductase
MAVIGSGPAGFYTAYKVMERIGNAVIDMYEQLPVPFGLVRFGVAPDHPEVKVKERPHILRQALTAAQNCQDKFQEVAESPNFNFIGNIGIGSEPGCVPLASIVPHYDAILFAYGASEDRKLGIPGENTLKGIYSARAFVGWYNGLPEYADLAPDLSQGEEAVVIGQGNVALDVARILLSDVDALRKTDITEVSLEALTRNRVKSVRVVGRRGPMQV